MASFWFLTALIMAFMASPLLSLSSHLNLESSTIATSPAFLSSPPPSPPSQELSPDIAPLLPSPGGVSSSPMTSSLPTIPSSPSVPNPDDLIAPGPASAFSPLGSLPASSAAPLNLDACPNLAVFVGLIVYWILWHFEA